MKINEPDLQDVIEGVVEDNNYSFNCHRVAIIESFNPAEQTATAKIVDKGTIINTDGSQQLVEYAPLVDCPVFTLKGAKGGFTIPINKGDSCLVCFNDRDLDNWLIDGLTQKPNTFRNHSFSDAIIIVGIRNQINKISDYNNEATEMSYEGNKISIDDSSISLDNVNNQIILDSSKISAINSLGGSIIIDDKLELKNTTQNLKLLVDELITIITGLKAVDNPAAPTETLVVDLATTNLLAALSVKFGQLLK